MSHKKISINRLLDEPYWNELPDLIDSFMTKMGIEEFYVYSNEYTSKVQITRELVSTMLTMILYGYTSKREFLFNQKFRRTRKNGVNSYLSKKDLIRISRKISMKKTHRFLDLQLDSYLADLPIEAWLQEQRLAGLITSRIKNLQEFWVLFNEISYLSKFISSKFEEEQ